MGRFDNQNFTDKNKKSHIGGMSRGGDVINMSEENGYGSADTDHAQSKGPGTYDPHPQDAAPINFDGMDNFRGNSRFTGDMGGQPRVELSGTGEKDSIETGGGGGDKLNRKAY